MGKMWCSAVLSFIIMFHCISRYIALPTSLLKLEAMARTGSSHSETNQDLSISYLKNKNRTTFEVKDTLLLEAKVDYTLMCARLRDKNDWRLKWEVNQYALQSADSYDNIITLHIVPNRFVHGLNISCIATSKGNRLVSTNTVTLILNTTTPHQTRIIATKEIPEELRPQLTPHCIVINKNSVKVSNLTKIYGGEDKQYRKRCADFVSTGKTFHYGRNHYYEMFNMTIKQTKFIVKSMNELPIQTLGDDDDNSQQAESDDYNKQETGSSFPTTEVVGGAIAIVTVVVTCLLLYKYINRRKEQKLLEHIYAEPNVHYAEIDLNKHGSVPHRDNTPYAQIIGVVMPKKNQYISRQPLKPRNKPPLPARNNYSSSVTDESRKDADYTRKDADNTCKYVDETRKDADYTRKDADYTRKDADDTCKYVDDTRKDADYTRKDNYATLRISQ